MKSIKVRNNGFVYCKSGFYSSADGLWDFSSYNLSVGINRLIGEIDSGVWAISYLLSMYTSRPKDIILFYDPIAVVDGEDVSFKKLSEVSCYMDKLYPLFSTRKTVRSLVMQGIKANRLNYTPEQVRDMFYIDSQRFERPLTGVGNEVFKAMAAIGCCHNKEVFCFPWLSKKRYDYYGFNLTVVLDILESMDKIVVVPVGR